jgi:hypothetical protein
MIDFVVASLLTVMILHFVVVVVVVVVVVLVAAAICPTFQQFGATDALPHPTLPLPLPSFHKTATNAPIQKVLQHAVQYYYGWKKGGQWKVINVLGQWSSGAQNPQRALIGID